MAELLEYLARQLVDEPDEVRVERVVRAGSAREQRRVQLEIVD